MLQSFHLGFQFLSHPSVTCKVEGSHLGLTDQQLKFQHFYNESNTKSPNMGRKRLPQFSDPPFIAGQHMLLPPTSAPPISQHCLAERPALHSARRARPMRPCPATASRERSWRQPALSTGSSCSARCSPPNQRYNWIANKTFPNNTHQRVRVEEPAPTQTAWLFMDNYYCARLDAYLQNEIYGMHHNLREGRNTQNSVSWQSKCTQTFQVSNRNWLSMRACGWA